MIERIEIAGCTSYGDTVAVMDALRVVNFIYGANGAGKTTVSRLIADANPFSKCVVSWRNSHKLQPLVYNRDFVRDNFSENSKLKGIFTLGKQDIGVQNQIDQAKSESDALLAQIGQLKTTLEGPHGDAGRRAALATIEDHFRDECWKLKHNAKFKDALRGFSQ
jgi:ABC-type branched-subunit amino acid transport system ATPase component